MELGKNGDVSSLLCGIHGGSQYGSHGGHSRLQFGHGEYPGGDDKVGQEEAEHHDDPGPDWQEGCHQTQTHGSVGHV